ncbi:MAG: hypothetical protein ACKO38_14540 [Planctomycetota bacterium]
MREVPYRASVGGVESRFNPGGRAGLLAAGSQGGKYRGVFGGSRGVVSRRSPIYFQQTNREAETPRDTYSYDRSLFGCVGRHRTGAAV